MVNQSSNSYNFFQDSVAWLLLIVIVALINNVSQTIVVLYVFLATAGFLLFLVFAIRPIFTKLVQLGAENDQISQFSVFAAFMLVFVSAWFTEAVVLFILLFILLLKFIL